MTKEQKQDALSKLDKLRQTVRKVREELIELTIDVESAPGHNISIVTRLDAANMTATHLGRELKQSADLIDS